MSIVKSFSVGEGDMFYIKHNADSFTIIDCCLPSERQLDILLELITQSAEKHIIRFISTHPDEDHLIGLNVLEHLFNFTNFYCTKNEATKSIITPAFRTYCSLRDSSHAFYVTRGCRRCWINKDDDQGKSAGITFLWPDITNEAYKTEQALAENGRSPNNASLIAQYSLNNGVSMLWMGDLEYDFMSAIDEEITFDKVNILFASHHGRQSGRIPSAWLEQLNPDIIVLGEAPSDQLAYEAYSSYNTITQNSAGDITFDCLGNKVHVYASNLTYTVDFLTYELPISATYIGTLTV